MVERLFTGKDRETLLQEGKARLQSEFDEFTLDFTNDPQRLLLDTLIYAARGLNFFTDVQANEMWLRTAQLPTAIDRIAAERAYNPRGAAPASGDLRLRPAAEQPFQVLLPEGFRFESQDGLVYETTSQTVWQPGSQQYKTVTLSQGVTRTATFRSDGTRFQRFDITPVEEDRFLAWRSPVVVVDGVTWEEKDALLDTDGQAYRVGYTSEPPILEFGDGVVGDVPADNAAIDVEFFVTRGREGAIGPGRIIGPVNPLVVGGTQVAFEIDDSTGEMTGASNEEPPSQIKARAPRADHSDGAVVVDEDFEGLVDGFQHPLFGKVAAARAIVATGIEKDLTAANLIRQIRTQFRDADAIVQAADSDLTALLDDVDSNLSDLQTDLSDALSEIGAGNTLASNLSSIESSRGTSLSSVRSAKSSASEIQGASSDAFDAADDAETTVSNISTGSSDQLTQSTKDDLLDKLNKVIAETRSNGPIQSSASSIQNTLANIKNELDSMGGDVDSAQDSRSTAETAVNDADDERVDLDALEQDIRDRVSQLVDDLVDPWEVAVLGTQTTPSKLDELETHLDGVLADICGPNVVSVPILTFDADGFYAPPSVGLQRAVESFIEEGRNEPSVVIRVVSGEESLVEPFIDVTFNLTQGFSINQVRSSIETDILAEIRGKKFGEDLPLDDLYESAFHNDGIDFVNVEITGFDGGRETESLIDSDGNLIIAEKEVLTRPTLTFFRRFDNGQVKKI